MSKTFFNGCFAALLLAAVPMPARGQKVAPTSVGTGAAARWTFTMGTMTFQAGPKNGGRIHSLKFGAAEILHMDTSTATNYGSTFWPSPQAAWNWPPPANLDGTGAYTATLGADTVLTLSGQVDNTTHLRIRKEYWASLGDSSYNMRFTLVNTGTARAWSPWQDTRLDTGGVYFFPKGSGPITGDLSAFTKDSAGMIWYTHNAASTLTTGTTKFYADGSLGWFAHAAPSRILLIKKFADAPLSKKAPSPENEIELYATNKPLNNADFVEMEVQGSYDSIAGNDSASWNMKWYIRRLPDSLNAAAGSQALIDYVNRILAGPVSVRDPGRAQGASSGNPVPHLRVEGMDLTLSLDAASVLSLTVTNVLGETVRRFHNGPIARGSHAFRLPVLPRGVHRLVLKNAAGQILESRLLTRL